MKSSEIRQKFLEFFKNKEHAILESASLVTSDKKGVTNSTLFNTAGVQPLIPYILGEDHPAGKRLASAQKCIRTIDINEVGDNTHLTFFEMLGNWSLGDYFKEKAIQWSYEFLTEELGLKPERLYVTVFGGNDDAPRDEDAFEIWKKYLPENRIFFLEDNWWAAGDNGPCGPDTEMFYDVTGKLGELNSLEDFKAADDSQKIVEVWNNVFMQYEKKDGQVVGKLSRHAVDTGAGLERLTVVVNNFDSVYEIDSFAKLVNEIETKAIFKNKEAIKIVADHIKAAVMLVSDGVIPDSSSNRGSLLSRLIRDATSKLRSLGIKENSFIDKLVAMIVVDYKNVYLNLDEKNIATILRTEIDSFTIDINKKMELFFKKIDDNGGIKNFHIDGKILFDFLQNYGIRLEIALAEINKLRILEGLPKISEDVIENFKKLYKQHQEKSRQGAEQKFKGGLAGNSEMEIKYHTATHLLHQALRDVLGEHVSQKGSNINPDRLRFDFSHSEKMTDEEKTRVEEIVNEKIAKALPVNQTILPKEEAEKTGALHLFGDKYGDEVSVYFVGEDLNSAYSKEFCGGPHVKNTSELGKFKIKKEEASSVGVRRIKAILE